MWAPNAGASCSLCLVLAFGPELAFPKRWCSVCSRLFHVDLYFLIELPWVKALRSSPTNPGCLPRTLITSGRFGGGSLLGPRCLGCVSVESVQWLEARVGSELHSRAVKCLSKPAAYSPLSSLVPSLILLNCFESLIPLVVKFSYHPPVTYHRPLFSLGLVCQSFNDLCS